MTNFCGEFEADADMNIHGSRDPIESANAVKHNQENSLIVMARNAKSLLA